MANLGKICMILILYAAAFLSFGSLLTVRKNGKEFSFSRTALYGFFLYHVAFQVVTIPLMLLEQPLSLLTKIWTVILFMVILIALICCGKTWVRAGVRNIKGLFGDEKWNWVPVIVTLISALVVSVLYVSFWDATYYVGQVSFSVYTDTINLVDPLSGEFLEFFDWKHGLATYQMEDAVMCRLTGIHPLIETKTIMVIVISVLTNLIYYQLGRCLFHGKKSAVAVFMLLTLAVNFCTYSAYSTSNFLFFRTYEGKAITGNLTIPFILLLMLELYRDGESRRQWLSFLLVAWGAVALASSAMFLVPTALAAGLIPYGIWKRRPQVWGKMILVMIPCLIVILCYLLNRLGWLTLAVHM